MKLYVKILFVLIFSIFSLSSCEKKEYNRRIMTDVIPIVHTTSNVIVAQYTKLLSEALLINKYLQTPADKKDEFELSYFKDYKIREKGDTCSLFTITFGDYINAKTIVSNNIDLTVVGSTWKAIFIPYISYNNEKLDCMLEVNITCVEDGKYKITSIDKNMISSSFSHNLYVQDLELEISVATETFSDVVGRNFLIKGSGQIIEITSSLNELSVDFSIQNGVSLAEKFRLMQKTERSDMNAVSPLEYYDYSYYPDYVPPYEFYSRFYSGEILMDLKNVRGYDNIDDVITVAYKGNYEYSTLTIYYKGKKELLDRNFNKPRY